MSTTTNLNTLKINYLTQAQYDAAEQGGTIDENELYLTPDTTITDVTVGGTSVVSDGVAAVPAIPTVPVTDVTVGGTSVVSSGTAAVPTVPTINLNGSSTTSSSFYAPTTAGLDGQILTSNGSGAPVWGYYWPRTSSGITTTITNGGDELNVNSTETLSTMLNTTWTFGDGPFSELHGNNQLTFTVNFSYEHGGSTINATSITFTPQTNDFDISYSTQSNVYSNGAWADDDYKTITITSDKAYLTQGGITFDATDIFVSALETIATSPSYHTNTLIVSPTETEIHNVVTPVYGGDAVNKTYADTKSTATNWENGTGTGAVKTKNATSASGNYSVAEGKDTTASGNSSHAEGNNTTASSYSHAEGYFTTASGQSSHAEGSNTIASGKYSHTQNLGTTANTKSQTVLGEYNELDTGGSTTTRGDYAFIVGNGTADNARSNALTVDWNGEVDLYLQEITDLTNTTWIFNEVLTEGLVGEFDMQYTSDNKTFNTLYLLYDSNNIFRMRYVVGTSNWYGAYNTVTGWNQQSFRTITITGGTDVTNSTVISWLKENAVCVSGGDGAIETKLIALGWDDVL